MKLQRSEAGTINVCWVCGRQFLAPGEMHNPICPDCEKTKTVPMSSTKEETDSTPYGEVGLAKSQERIASLVDATKDLLLYKNKMYGDSALNPIGIFTAHLKSVPANTASILVRLDDKLGRVKNAPALRINDVSDIIGYCTLLLVSMGATKEDIEKFKD